MARQKFYVVWSGLNTGIYSSWEECESQIKGVKNARFKAFNDREQAERAYAIGPTDPIHRTRKTTVSSARHAPDYILNSNAIASDAACSRNPGPMEYRGVYLPTGQELFHFGPVYGTNNIGEFLGIVHAMALIRREGWSMSVYSDSHNAIKWANEGKCKTKLALNEQTRSLFALINRAEIWLANNPIATRPPLLKWDTDHWGEIPADFGRK